VDAFLWFFDQWYRLFFNNTEEVKMSCSGERGKARAFFRARGRMGWIVSTRSGPVSSGPGRERKHP
jgi:hypothetical protein